MRRGSGGDGGVGGGDRRRKLPRTPQWANLPPPLLLLLLLKRQLQTPPSLFANNRQIADHPTIATRVLSVVSSAPLRETSHGTKLTRDYRMPRDSHVHDARVYAHADRPVACMSRTK